jgi:putative hydrolase of the HAD superfamily
MTIPKAILFDLDDTIVSFYSATIQAWELCCEEFVTNEVVDFDSTTLLQKIDETKTWYWSDAARHKAGRENMKMARRQVVQGAFETLDYYDVESMHKLADSYSDLQEELLCLFEGAYEALNTIKDLNIRIAIITNGNSQKQRGKLERFKLNHFFEQVLVDTEVGFSKPDRRIFELALEKMSLQADEVWMVGDNLVWDIEGAAQLGIYTVWNDFKKEGLPVNSGIIPNKTIYSISELAEEIKLQAKQQG